MPAKVLVVEDDLHLRMVIRMVLEKDGYEVIDAANGRDGIDMLVTNAVNVVVADMRMPVMSGAEMTAKIRSNPTTSGTPILVLTGVADRPECDANAWLQKPFEADDLSAAVARLIEHS